MNTTALPQLASCPALPPPPVPDVDCAGAWDPCTAACELADSRGLDSRFNTACAVRRRCSRSIACSAHAQCAASVR